MNVNMRNLPTDKLWETIISNAIDGLEHTDWLNVIGNIKVLVLLIDERISRFQRECFTEKLAMKHRTMDESVKEKMRKTYQTPV